MINNMRLIKSLLLAIVVFSSPVFSAETLFLPLDIYGKPGDYGSGLAVSASVLLADSFTITHKEEGVFEIQSLAAESALPELQSIVTVLKNASTRTSEEIIASDDLFAVGDGTAARIAQGGRAGFQMPVGLTIKINGLFQVNQHLIMPIKYESDGLVWHKQVTFYCEEQVCRFSDFGNWPVARAWLAKGAIVMIAREMPASLEYDVKMHEGYEIIVPDTEMSSVHVYLDIERHDIDLLPSSRAQAGRYQPIREFFQQGKESAAGTVSDFAEFLVTVFKHDAANKQGYLIYKVNSDGVLKNEVIFLDGWKNLLSSYSKAQILGSTPITGGELVWCLLKMKQGERVLMVMPLLKTESGLETNMLAVNSTTYFYINQESIFAAVWKYLLQEPITFVDSEVPYADIPPEQRMSTLTISLLIAGFIILTGGLAFLWRRKKYAGKLK